MLSKLVRQELLTTCILCAGYFGFLGPAHGQAVYPGSVRETTTPYRPTLSPYLNLLRTDNSVLSPYHAFVVPQRERQQQQALQSTQIQRLQRSVPKMFSSGSARSERLPTGNGGRFQTYLHYYPFNSRQ